MRGAVLDYCNSQTSHWSAILTLSFECYSLKFLDITRRTPRFFIGHHPLMSTLMPIWRHARNSISPAFHRFYILQAIKNWRPERPRNEAILGPSNWYSCFWFSAHINNYALRNLSNSTSPHAQYVGFGVSCKLIAISLVTKIIEKSCLSYL